MRAPRLLLTGAGGNASQNFAHALRMHWPDVVCVGCDLSPLHIETSQLDARYVVPRCTDPSYLDALNTIIERESIDFVHPQPDPEVAFLAANRGDLKAPVALPASQTIDLAQDKMAATAAMDAAGVAVPVARPVLNDADIEAAVAEVQTHTEKIWLRAIRGAGSKAALPVINADQARSWINYWIEMKGLSPGDFMMSEFLPGKEFAFQSLWHNGELVTSMARERVEYLFGNLLPSGQSSSPSVAITVHRGDVNETGKAAVLALNSAPHGVFCVDMKEDAEAKPRVTEINAGRFFTTSNFFSAIGANMPADYVTLGLGGELVGERSPFNAAEAGVYWLRGVDRSPTLIRPGEWTTQTIN